MTTGGLRVVPVKQDVLPDDSDNAPDPIAALDESIVSTTRLVFPALGFLRCESGANQSISRASRAWRGGGMGLVRGVVGWVLGFVIVLSSSMRIQTGNGEEKEKRWGSVSK